MVNDWDVLAPFCSYRKRGGAPPAADARASARGAGEGGGDGDGEEGAGADVDDELYTNWRITRYAIMFVELVFAIFGIHHSFDDLYLGVQLASAYLRARDATFRTFAELVSLRTELFEAEEEDEEAPAADGKPRDGETRTQIETRMFARLRKRHHGVYFNSILLRCLKKEMDLYDAECMR